MPQMIENWESTEEENILVKGVIPSEPIENRVLTRRNYHSGSFQARTVELSEFIKPNRTVQQAVKNMVIAIRGLYNKSQKEKRKNSLP